MLPDTIHLWRSVPPSQRLAIGLWRSNKLRAYLSTLRKKRRHQWRSRIRITIYSFVHATVSALPQTTLRPFESFPIGKWVGRASACLHSVHRVSWSSRRLFYSSANVGPICSIYTPRTRGKIAEESFKKGVFFVHVSWILCLGMSTVQQRRKSDNKNNNDGNNVDDGEFFDIFCILRCVNVFLLFFSFKGKMACWIGSRIRQIRWYNYSRLISPFIKIQ